MSYCFNLIAESGKSLTTGTSFFIDHVLIKLNETMLLNEHDETIHSSQNNVKQLNGILMVISLACICILGVIGE